MTKLHPNGKMEVKGIGEVGWEIQIGHGANVGNWYTSLVMDIIRIGKGLLIETLNSTYLIEEFDVDQIIRDDSKE
jgi:hypothetical protein